MSHFTIPTFKLPEFVAKIGARLPQWPHALGLVGGLNGLLLLKLLDAEALARLPYLGTPRALADMDGNVVQTMWYDAFGNPLRGASRGAPASPRLRGRPFLRPGESSRLARLFFPRAVCDPRSRGLEIGRAHV